MDTNVKAFGPKKPLKYKDLDAFLSQFARSKKLPLSSQVLAVAGKKHVIDGVVEVTDQNFDEEILAVEDACLVYFTLLKPTEAISSEYKYFEKLLK